MYGVCFTYYKEALQILHVTPQWQVMCARKFAGIHLHADQLATIIPFHNFYVLLCRITTSDALSACFIQFPAQRSGIKIRNFASDRMAQKLLKFEWCCCSTSAPLSVLSQFCGTIGVIGLRTTSEDLCQLRPKIQHPVSLQWPTRCFLESPLLVVTRRYWVTHCLWTYSFHFRHHGKYL